jgi:hypothetical protein
VALASFEGSVAFVKNWQKAGKCKEIYYHHDLKGIVAIWELESDEECLRTVMENPMSPFQDVAVQPIVGWEIGVKAVREAFQKQARK